WLWNGHRRIKHESGTFNTEVTASQLFELIRKNIFPVFNSAEDWAGDIPQAVVDTSRVPDWYLGPINQGIDKSQRLKVVKLELVKGLNRIMALVESFDRLTSQQAQLEQMSKMSLSPSELKAMLALPQGNAAAVLLVAPTSSMKKHDA
ncbi:MAG: hypothetical protein ACKOOC_07845, partial [Cyanobium sp.]